MTSDEAIITAKVIFCNKNGELKFYNGVKVETIKVNAKDRAQMLLAMDMRDSVRKVIDIQVNDGSDADLENAQKTLNDVYDKYIKIYGHICEDASLKKLFGNDSAYPLLRSLEEYDKKGYKGKSPIFSKRMIEPHQKPSHADSPADALAISMQEVGRVELDYMKALTGQTEEEIIKALEFDRIFFDFQKKEYQLAEEYLSGDVRAKIEATEIEIQQIDAEIDRKIASAVLKIGNPPTYEPKNELEKKIIESNPNLEHYFSFANYYDEKEKIRYSDYIETQKDNRDFMLQVALRQGISSGRDKVDELLADKPLLALEAIRLGRDVGYAKQSDLLILACLRTMGESFDRTGSEHDLMLYDFLKKRLAKYENYIQAIREQVDNYYQRSDMNNIEQDWQQYKIDYQRQKNIEKDKVNPEIEHLREKKARLEKNLAALMDALGKFPKEPEAGEKRPAKVELFARMLDDLKKLYSPMYYEETKETDRLAIIKWCVDNTLFQQAATFCTEWLPEYFVDWGVLYTDDLAVQRYCNMPPFPDYRPWNKNLIMQFCTQNVSKEDKGKTGLDKITDRAVSMESPKQIRKLIFFT